MQDSDLPPKTRNILIVDDKADNLLALRALLQNLRPQYNIETISNGADGMARAEEWHPDIILLDISMPGMDGYEVCRRLKKNPDTAHIPVILLTAYQTDTHSRVRGLEEGADAFLTKPVEPGELIAQITAMLRIKDAEDILRAQKSQLENKVSERTREVAESRMRYQLLYDYAPDIYCNVDGQIRIININEYGARYLGYTREELKDRSLPDLLHPGDRELFRNRLEGQTAHGGNFRMHKKDGSILYVSERSQRVADLGEGESGMLIILRDVTDSHLMTEELQRREEEFRTLYENLPVGVYRTDADGKILLANPAMVRMLGFETLAEVQALSNIRTQLGYDNSRMLHRLKVEGHFEGMESHFHRRDGTEIVTRENAVTVRDHDGAFLYHEGTIEDITTQRRTEEALTDSEARFVHIAEHATDAIIGFDTRGRIMLWNQAAERMFACPVSDVFDTECSRFLPFLDETTLTEFSAWTPGEEGGIQEAEARRSDGSTFPIELSISALKQDQKTLFYGIIRNVSERKRLEREREEALRRAQHGEQVKALFIANMSHEIRTPLNTILGFTALLEEDLRETLNGEQKDYFDSIAISGTRLTNTIHSILNLSQLEAGAVAPQREPHDIIPVLRRIVSEHERHAYEKGLRLDFDPECSEAECLIDQFMFIEAVSNLLDNAIKYTQEGSVVVNAQKHDGESIISIEDTGIGIPGIYMERLFEPFSQASEGYTKEYQGVGLGLALTKRYIELNCGSIAIDSVEQRGTRVVLHLPLASRD
ncbi:MAG: PAS domain S-box protein [Bacteroidetes bacterium]|nr:PAS domain S-box protein [Bacteroidota bacterium]